MAHYVNIASGSFFWRGFLFVCRLALVYFFANTFLKLQIHLQKNKVVLVRWLTKTMTKKNCLHHRIAAMAWVCALACCGRVVCVRVFSGVR